MSFRYFHSLLGESQSKNGVLITSIRRYGGGGGGLGCDVISDPESENCLFGHLYQTKMEKVWRYLMGGGSKDNVGLTLSGPHSYFDSPLS